MNAPSGERDEKFEEFLITEHEQLSEAFLRNEEDGEKRVTFLITLAGGAGAVLAFLREDDRWRGDLFVSFGLAALLILGFVTYLRVINRNVAADNYLDGLNRVRRYFLEHTTTPRAIEYLPFIPPRQRKMRTLKAWSIGKGGWLEMVVVINALLMFVLVAFGFVVAASAGLWPSLLAGVIAATATWLFLVCLANTLYASARHAEWERRRAAETQA